MFGEKEVLLSIVSFQPSKNNLQETDSNTYLTLETTVEAGFIGGKSE